MERIGGAVDPSELNSFKQLGQREQRAVHTASAGIQSWQEKRLPPRPMRVRVTPDNPFDIRGFAGVLHEMQIGISDSLTRDEADPNIVTFQPRPYSRTFMPQNDRDRLDALRETVGDEMDALRRVLPLEMLRRLGL